MLLVSGEQQEQSTDVDADGFLAGPIHITYQFVIIYWWAISKERHNCGLQSDLAQWNDKE